MANSSSASHVYEVWTRTGGNVSHAITGMSRQWTSLQYRKRYQAGGEFTIRVGDEAPEISRMTPGHLIEITRDGVTDFVGIVTRLRYIRDEQAPSTSLCEIYGVTFSAWRLSSTVALPMISGAMSYMTGSPTGGAIWPAANSTASLVLPWAYWSATGPAEDVLKSLVYDQCVGSFNSSLDNQRPNSQDYTVEASHGTLKHAPAFISASSQSAFNFTTTPITMTYTVPASQPSTDGISAIDWWFNTNDPGDLVETGGLTGLAITAGTHTFSQTIGSPAPSLTYCRLRTTYNSGTIAGFTYLCSQNNGVASGPATTMVGAQSGVRYFKQPPVGGIYTSGALGAIVTVNLRGDNVLDAAAQIAVAGGVGFRDAIVNNLPQFQAYTGINRAAGQTGQAIFTPEFHDILSIQFEQDKTQLQNKIYYLASTGGASVNQVIGKTQDLTNISTFGCRETWQSSQNGTTTAQLQTAGAAYIAGSENQSRVQFRPRGNAQNQYKTGWDLGDTVTCVYSPWGLNIAEAITEIAIAFEQGKGETIDVQVGAIAPDILRQMRILNYRTQTLKPSIFSG